MYFVYSIIIGLALSAVVTIFIYTLKNGIPPMPTTRYLCEQTAKLLSEYQLPNGRAVEAGSGWGTLALFLGRRFPQIQFTGLENSPLPLWVSRLLRIIFRRDNCRFIRHDLYHFQYSESKIVICYLFAGAMRRLSPIFRQQLPEGALIISIFFALPDWTPHQVVQCNDLYRTKIYVYKIQ